MIEKNNEFQVIVKERNQAKRKLGNHFQFNKDTLPQELIIIWQAFEDTETILEEKKIASLSKLNKQVKNIKLFKNSTVENLEKLSYGLYFLILVAFLASSLMLQKVNYIYLMETGCSLSQQKCFVQKQK